MNFGKEENLIWGYFHPFGCKCFVLNTKDKLGKLDSKSDEAIFLGYSTQSRAYRIFNRQTLKVEESINVVFDESVSVSTATVEDEDDLGLSSSTVVARDKQELDHVVSSETTIDAGDTPKEVQAPPHIQKRHPISQVIGNMNQGMTTRSQDASVHIAFVSLVVPKNSDEALMDEFWNASM
ncbi:unnamed protein product [Linum trigynum]|uniref:Retroviral polymerase SH3-like domain-containing protein n=1 Tax=Linum trigynum TaxID=586398 RepID=A0AAV2EB31_9ROSI